MKTWEDYQKQVQSDALASLDIKEAEQLARVIGAIVKRRLELGISQGTLAAMCNMERTAITHFENFRTIPNFMTIVRIASALGLKIELAADRTPQNT